MAHTETSERGLGFETASLTGVHWAAIGLAVLTGLVHLYLFWTQDFVPFLLAGLGFFGAIGLILVGFHRRLIYLAGIPYTLAQMGGWYVLDGNLTALAVVDKAAQVALIVLLVYLYRRDSSQTARTAADQTT